MAESVSRMHINKKFVNEPHVGNAPKKLCFEGEPRAERRARRAREGPRGNPVASSKGLSYFNDMLGTTVGSKQGGKYSAVAPMAFGESLETLQGEVTSNIKHWKQCQVGSVSQRAFIFFNGSLDKQNVGVRNNETIFV